MLPLRWLGLLACLCMALALWALRPAEPLAELAAEPPLEAEIAKLIALLDDPRFEQREEAAKRLEEIGVPALPALREAARSPVAAISQRSRILIQTIEQRGDTALLLDPTLVEIDCDAQPLEQVLRGIGVPARVNFRIEDAELRAKKITFKTEGRVPFWVAFEKLAEHAGFRVAMPPAPGDKAAQEADPDEIPMPRRFRQRMQGAATEEQATTTLHLVPEPMVPAVSAQLGAVWVRMSPIPPKAGNTVVDERRYQLDVYTEPKLQWQAPLEMRLVAVRDDKSQEATLITLVSMGEDQPLPEERIIPLGRPYAQVQPAFQELMVRLRVAEEPGKLFPLFHAHLVGRVATKQAAITVDDVLKAKDTTTRNQAGDELRVVDCTVRDDGTVLLKVEIRGPSGEDGVAVQRAGNIQAQVQVWGGNMPQMRLGNIDVSENLVLFDSEGRRYQGISRSFSTQVGANGVVQTGTVRYQPPSSDSTPGKLLYHNGRPTPLQVEFKLRDVPIP
ncbi:MAG TPA: hypothetical protein PKD86_16760 [Gemmatales bacterium]|nr:hypothetical protein [Gemmatales bacterium]HMP60997.1 hypothetical protein [Gemmatales bacterium]